MAHKKPKSSHKAAVEMPADNMSSPDTTMEDSLSTPWEKWGDAQRAQADAAIKALDKVKTYREFVKSGFRGGVASDPEVKRMSDELQAAGDIPPEMALQLGRYRMASMAPVKQGYGPDWQGPVNAPTGAPTPKDTFEDMSARREALMNVTGEDRLRAWQSQAEPVDRGHEDYYGNLASKAKSIPSEATAVSLSMRPGETGAYTPATNQKFLPQPKTDNEKLADSQLRMLYTLATGGQNADIQEVQPPLLAPEDLLQQTMEDPNRTAMDAQLHESMKKYYRQ